MRITVDVPDYDGNSLDVIWDREGNIIFALMEIVLYYLRIERH